jgi:acetyl esterase/lipase
VISFCSNYYLDPVVPYDQNAHRSMVMGAQLARADRVRFRRWRCSPGSGGSLPCADACVDRAGGGVVTTISYVFNVAIVGWCVVCALTRWRRLGGIALYPALVVSQLPLLAAYLVIIYTVLAFTTDDFGSPWGAAAGGFAALVTAGTVVLIVRELQARVAIEQAMATDGPHRRRPWLTIAIAPVPLGRRRSARVRNIPYGDDHRQRLDVYHPRGDGSGRPVLLHLHGGGFRSGTKTQEARPLIRHLTASGWVCVSADYRLRPHATGGDQAADAAAAIAWVRAHAGEYGGDPAELFVTGSSAGAYLAVQAIMDGAPGVAGVIGRYGYYGDLTPTGDVPPMLILHGTHDLRIPPADARRFADRVRAVSSHPVTYIELIGAHHPFDMFASIRASAVAEAVEAFAASTLRHR